MNKVRVEKLANEHWDYLCEVLVRAYTPETTIWAIEYHFKTAFTHGYKHACEDYNINGMATPQVPD